MRATSDLIDALVARGGPVRRVWPPAARAAAWFLLAVAVIAVLAWLHGVRPDLAQRLRERAFRTSLATAVLTGALAAVAAFTVSLPDRSRLWLLLPAPALLAWIGTVTLGCLGNWITLDPAAMQMGEVARCFATLLLSGVPLSAAMFWLLRRTARLRPAGAVLAGAVSVAALTAAALSLLHAFDASLMVLAWNFGAAALVIALDGAIGWRVLRPR